VSGCRSGSSKQDVVVSTTSESPATTPAAIVEPAAQAFADVLAAEDSPGGQIPVTVVRPVDRNESLRAVIDTHGGGWTLGSFATDEGRVRDLAVQTDAAFVFVNSIPSPEARYPVGIAWIYATVKWVAKDGAFRLLTSPATSCLRPAAGDRCRGLWPCTSSGSFSWPSCCPSSCPCCCSGNGEKQVREFSALPGVENAALAPSQGHEWPRRAA
jgi:hypothetical protein